MIRRTITAAILSAAVLLVGTASPAAAGYDGGVIYIGSRETPVVSSAWQVYVYQPFAYPGTFYADTTQVYRQTDIGRSFNLTSRFYDGLGYLTCTVYSPAVRPWYLQRHTCRRPTARIVVTVDAIGDAYSSRSITLNPLR